MRERGRKRQKEGMEWRQVETQIKGERKKEKRKEKGWKRTEKEELRKVESREE
jgi:hypothetical protein